MPTTTNTRSAAAADDFSAGAFEAPLDSVVSGLEYVEGEVRRLDALRMGLYAQAARIGEKGGELERRSVRAEIATALHLSEYTVASKLMLGASLMHDYRRVHTALESGGVSQDHARVIVDAGIIIGAGSFGDSSDSAEDSTDDGGPRDERLERVHANRDEYAARVLVHAVNVTPGRLRPIARRIAEEYAEVTLDERHAAAASRRQVCVYDAEDGMADLYAHLPAVEAHAIYDRLTQAGRKIMLARALSTIDEGERKNTKADADTGAEDATGATDGATGPTDDTTDRGGPSGPVKKRTMDELRADIFADLLLAANPPMIAGTGIAAIQGRVQVVVPSKGVGMQTSKSRTSKVPTGHTSCTCDACFTEHTAPAGPVGDRGRVSVLMKHGPIPNSTSRHLAGTASHWENIDANPDTGDVLKVDRYRPSERMRRTLAARDLHCRFPGCRAPISRCDIDHTVDAAKGGATSTANLSHLCRGHHVLKHQTGWRVTQFPGGVMEWVSPTGRIHIDRPPSRVYFQSSQASSDSEPNSHQRNRSSGPSDRFKRWRGAQSSPPSSRASTKHAADSPPPF